MALLDELARIKATGPPVPPTGERRKLRELVGLTQRELSLLLDVHESTVSLWENGRRAPTGEAGQNYLWLLVGVHGAIYGHPESDGEGVDESCQEEAEEPVCPDCGGHGTISVDNGQTETSCATCGTPPLPFPPTPEPESEGSK